MNEQYKQEMNSIRPSDRAVKTTLAAMRSANAAAIQKEERRRNFMKNENKKVNRNKFKIYAAACLAAALTVALLVGVIIRQVNPAIDSEINISYQTEHGTVTVRSLTEENTPSIMYSPEWDDVSNYDIKEECDLVSKVRILDVQEVEILYEPSNPIELPEKFAEHFNLNARYGSLVTAEIEQVYYDPDNTRDGKDTVVFYTTRSRIWEDGNLPEIAIGEEYYLFMKDSKRVRSEIDFSRFSDYALRLSHIEDYHLRKDGVISERMAELLINNCKDKETARRFIYEGADIENALTYVFQ